MSKFSHRINFMELNIFNLSQEFNFATFELNQ